MKNRTIISTLLVLASTGTYAKDFFHTPTIGEYDKQQVAYLTLEEAEEHLSWDLSKKKVLDKILHVSNEQSPYDENYIIGTEHSTRYSYQSQSDSLLLWGYENHTSTVRYNMPEVIYQENLGIGGHTKGFFHGLEMYCGKLAFRIFGSYDFEVVGKGTLILPTGDSLRNVTLTHYVKAISKVKYPKIKSLDELANYVFNEKPYDKDSIIYNQKNDDEIITVHQYKWYADGYRYPIYESISTSTSKKGALYKTAYYISPAEQEKQYDEPNERLRAQHSSYDFTKMGNDSNSTRGTETISISGQTKNSNNATITIDSPISTKADLTIYTSNGILVDKKSNISITRGKSNYTFNISQHQSDVYIITCNINGNTISQKIVY